MASCSGWISSCRFSDSIDLFFINISEQKVKEDMPLEEKNERKKKAVAAAVYIFIFERVSLYFSVHVFIAAHFLVVLTEGTRGAIVSEWGI